MSKVILVFLIFHTFSFSEEFWPKGVYGEDSRKDVQDSLDLNIQNYAKSVAAMIHQNDLIENEENFDISFRSLEISEKVCSTEKFSHQNSISRCTGFLVGKDIMVTAGHCLKDERDCTRYHWVFDYKVGVIDDHAVSKEAVYRCKKILRRSHNKDKKKDFAIFKLSETVKNRTPLKFRKKGKVKIGEDLILLGHPTGLPLKVSFGKVVKSIKEHRQFFRTNLDAFGGNSGSPVINKSTGVVEGILTRGGKDYIWDNSRDCRIVKTCSGVNEKDENCKGEEIQRIKKIGLKRYFGFWSHLRSLFSKKSSN